MSDSKHGVSGRIFEAASRLSAALAAAILPGAAGAQTTAETPGLRSAQPNEAVEWRCGIDQHLAGTSLHLQGTVTGATPARGTYTFLIRKSGAGGTSNIRQGGAFTLEPGLKAGVGQVNISLERGARYDAILTLEIEGRTIECRASGPTVSDL